MRAQEDEEAAATAGPYEQEEDIQYPFYTEGSQSLLKAQREIAKYFTVKSALRLHRARRKRVDPDDDLDAEIDCSLKQAANPVLESSEIGDERPLSGCSRSHDGKMFATCKTNVKQIEDAFKDFTAREDIAIILISQYVSNNHDRFLVDSYNKPIPAILEIPSMDHPV
ncbi:hypothetical protein OROHE_012503 [Orobanche hederae]